MGRGVLLALGVVTVTAAACGLWNTHEVPSTGCLPAEHACGLGGCCLHNQRCGPADDQFPQGTCIAEYRIGGQRRPGGDAGP